MTENPTAGDDWGLTNPVGLDLRRLFPLLGSLFPPAPDPLRAVQLRLALLELAERLGVGQMMPLVDFGVLAKELVGDWVVIGARGSGKTATAVKLAQLLGVKWYGLGWKKELVKRVGGESVSEVSRLRDCTLVADEAGLVYESRADALYELITLARQRRVKVIWTAQSLAGVSRDVLRLNCHLAFKRLDPLGARFDREEVTDLVSQVATIQGRWPGLASPSGLVVYSGGRWMSTEVGLPDGWDEDVSRLWA